MQYDNIDPDSHGQSKGKVFTLAERIQKVNSDPKVYQADLEMALNFK